MSEYQCECCGYESNEELSYGQYGRPLCDDCSLMRYCSDCESWVDEDEYEDHLYD